MRLAALVGGALAVAMLTTAAAVSAKSSKPATINYKVGLVTDIGGLNDHGFNHLAYVGLLRAEKLLGIQGKVVTSTDGTQYVPNLSSLAKGGYNLVIGVGFLQEQAIQQVAAAYPNTKFAGVDMNAPGDFKGGITKNFEGLVFKEEQVGYEVGYLAGLEAKREGKNTVSSVGGIAVPAVVRYIAGFQAGAKAADPGITTLNGYSNDFVAQDKCKNVALSQIAQGSVVVFQVAGGCGLGALDAAKEKGVWGIGVDADQAYIGPQVLTSAQKKVDRAVYVAILDQVKRNVFAGGTNLVFNAKNGGVGLGKVSAKVPAAELAKVRAIAGKVASGKIVPPTQCSPKPTC
ncbi:MAG TPA: BMP family ABC transporter substrate-binding protein [Gaiellaceae bacterium]|nr:BMP family ABC transporter substrate-binding protein [Gaiellaceae bacterium]